jgi:hypothetical protein
MQKALPVWQGFFLLQGKRIRSQAVRRMLAFACLCGWHRLPVSPGRRGSFFCVDKERTQRKGHPAIAEFPEKNASARSSPTHH